ncbi:uncharacterized protein LOC112053278 [Bicyclus anynana]|uniref:Uncharacterized protein LOC112053278 n=1 Tax=Bicyclus anynana TaxID=110368 RepID=A0A6J1NKZ2_BICAN|nr:uncharacterized protein LOC112053278 [Bicyclus anynana]
MENITQCFSLNYKQILIDEIALDGLQGIGLETLWKRVEKRINSPLTSKMKEKFWKYITNKASITIFQVPEPPPVIEVIDRFTIVDTTTGYIADPQTFLDGPYEYSPVENEYGSCTNYTTRILLKDTIQSMSYEEVNSKYEGKLVAVASMEERWHALASHLPMDYMSQLTPIHYALLELIGKGRENGQMTVGTTNLSKIVNEPKLLFYNRSVLQKLDLIDVHYSTQFTFGKAMKSILLRLKRFKQPAIGNFPKKGLIADTIKYLLEKPDHSEINEIVIRKKIYSSKDSKRFQKALNIFTFEDRDVKVIKSKNSKGEKKTEFVKKKFISIVPKSDESSSDEEIDKTPLQCQYKVGVGLMRQAYERILEAGLKGLTQTEIAQLLGVEFYTGRSICRIFKNKNLVREFLEDKGRQRTARYVAVAATKEIDQVYTKEKNILLEHAKSVKEKNESNIDESNSDSDDIPVKKLKLHKEKEKTESTVREKYKTESTPNSITEVKTLEGFENVNESLLNTKKKLTLRQLKFANGILKIVKERDFILGFQTLNMIVSKEIGEPQMDAKGLKKFVQKLLIDNQLKVLKITNLNKIYFLICAPNIKPTDDVIKNKYKQLCVKPVLKKKTQICKVDNARPKWQFIYQRYIKIQKLHEFLTKFVYFNDDKSTIILNQDSQGNVLKHGFSSLLTIIPQMTVEFALSNLNNLETSDVAKVKIDTSDIKICEAEEKLKNLLSHSQSIQNSIKVILKILAALGLIQLVHTPSTSRKNSANSCIFYINRHAKILNTTGKWPRPVDGSVIEKSYYFNTFDDVMKYWHDVTNISSNTIINAPKRETLKLRHPLRNEADVGMFDNGERLGDGLGPCGFDSSIFMDIPRLWRKFVFKTPNIPQQTGPKRKAKRVVKRRNKPKKVVNKEIVAKVDKRKRIPDGPALKWSDFEDKILMLCKAAVTVLSPTSQPGSLRVRNIVAKDLLTMIDRNKTAAYCHKRSAVLDSNSKLAHEKDCIVNEMRRHRHLIKKYDNLLKVLRHRHIESTAKYINEARLPLLELVWLASQIETIKPYVRRIPCIALNVEDFHRKYMITAMSSNRPYNVYRTPVTCEPEFATLKEGILLTVMLSLDNQVTKDIAKKIYNIYEVYPESTLRSAVDELRKGGVIAARAKCLNNNLKKIHFDEIVESSYRISVAYRRKMDGKFELEFIAKLADIMSNPLPEKGLKGSSEINCLLFEMEASDVINIKLENLPIITGSAGSIIQEEQMNVIDMETKYKLKTGTVAWTSERNIENFLEVYQDIQFKSILDSISKESIVTFSDNDVYDMNDPVILYLEGKGEKGSTFHELQNQLSTPRSILCERLKDLEKKKKIKRVGYYENLITLTKCATPMLLQIEPNFHIIPTPWLTLGGQIRTGVFIKWTSVIVNKIFELPGCSIEYLSNNIECISIRSVQDICNFLQGCECVVLRCIEKRDVDLFSDDDYVPELTEYNPYDSPDNILVFPVNDMLSRYACLRKALSNERDPLV